MLTMAVNTWKKKLDFAEEGHPILDSRVMDGFKVRFTADKIVITERYSY